MINERRLQRSIRFSSALGAVADDMGDNVRVFVGILIIRGGRVRF